MLKKKCPYCGSRNTELKICGYVGYGVVRTIATTATVVAGVATTPLGSFISNATSNAVQRGVENWGDSIDRHHCCNCGKDFL